MCRAFGTVHAPCSCQRTHSRVRTEFVLIERESIQNNRNVRALPIDRQGLPDAISIGERIRRASQAAAALDIIERIRIDRDASRQTRSDSANDSHAD